MDPVRTCLGCRQRVDASQLLRFVVRDGVMTPDPEARLDGRGAWVHPTRECAEASIKRRAWGRAFRSSGALSPEQVLAWIHHNNSDSQSGVPYEQAD